MAKDKLIFASSFLLLLLFSCEIITFIEGRPWKTVMEENHEKYMRRGVLEEGASDEPGTVAAGQRRITQNVIADTDDFRPTTPGHSPGAGHSIGPAAIGGEEASRCRSVEVTKKIYDGDWPAIREFIYSDMGRTFSPITDFVETVLQVAVTAEQDEIAKKLAKIMSKADLEKRTAMVTQFSPMLHFREEQTWQNS